MGALQDKRNRSLDSVWASNKEIIAVLEAMMGVTIGTDNGPLFIQDAGEKVKDRVYIDKNTGKMYICVITTGSVLNDSNFSSMNVFSTYKSLRDIFNPTNIYEKYFYMWAPPTDYAISNTNPTITLGTVDASGICILKYMYTQTNASGGEDRVEFMLNDIPIGWSQYVDVPADWTMGKYHISGSLIFRAVKGDVITARNCGVNTTVKDFSGYTQTLSIFLNE